MLFALGVAFAASTYASFDRYVEQATRSNLAGSADAIWIDFHWAPHAFGQEWVLTDQSRLTVKKCQLRDFAEVERS